MSDSELRTTDSTSNVYNVCVRIRFSLSATTTSTATRSAIYLCARLGSTYVIKIWPSGRFSTLEVRRHSRSRLFIKGSPDIYIRNKPLTQLHYTSHTQWTCELRPLPGCTALPASCDASDLMPTVCHCWTLRDNAVKCPCPLRLARPQLHSGAGRRSGCAGAVSSERMHIRPRSSGAAVGTCQYNICICKCVYYGCAERM